MSSNYAKIPKRIIHIFASNTEMKMNLGSLLIEEETKLLCKKKRREDAEQRLGKTRN